MIPAPPERFSRLSANEIRNVAVRQATYHRCVSNARTGESHVRCRERVSGEDDRWRRSGKEQP